VLRATVVGEDGTDILLEFWYHEMKVFQSPNQSLGDVGTLNALGGCVNAANCGKTTLSDSHSNFLSLSLGFGDH